MFDRFARSWSLVKASASVLKADKELLVFPLISTVAAIVVVASFIGPAYGTGLLERLFEAEEPGVGVLAFGFAFYLVQYFVIFFFNTALVGAAMIRLDGGDPTVRDGLRIAWGKKGAIFGYAAIAATVGMALRAIEQRVGFVGQLIVGLIGAAWTVATFLTVPILVARDIGPVDAVKESVVLLKRTWGENLIGAGGIGLVLGLINVLIVIGGSAVAFALFAAGGVMLGGIMIGITVLAVLAMVLVQAALSGIYSAALYRYAVVGEAPSGFDSVVLQNAFQRKV